MTRRSAICVACVSAALAIASAPLLVAQSEGDTKSPQSAPERGAAIVALIEQLDDDSYEAREAASRELAEAGDDAAELLAAASKHPSPEVRFRAAQVLATIARRPIRELEEQIADLASLSEEKIDVERGMCLIARVLDPQVRDQQLIQKLDAIAEKVRQRLGKGIDPEAADPQAAVAALRHVLYEDYRFRGNAEDYNNPDNCSLAFVLATGKGKPVLLGELVVAVARRLKIPIVGVPVSGRYLVKYDGSKAPAGYPRDDIFLHPFEGGRILTRQDRAREFPHHDPDRMVPPAGNRETLARILRNIVADLDERDDAAAPHRRELAERMLELLESDR